MGEDITKAIRPLPPSIGPGSDPQAAIAQIGKHLQDLALYDNKINDVISSDFIVRGSQITDLTVDDLLKAQFIITQMIQIGNEAHALTLDNTPRLRVWDGARYRVVLGKEGSDYGLWIRDADGNLIVGASGLGVNSVGSDQLEDGAVGIRNLGTDVVLGDLNTIVNLDSAGDNTTFTYGPNNSSAPTTSPGTVVTHGDIQWAYIYETGRVYKRTRSMGTWGEWIDITLNAPELPPIASQITDPDTAAAGSFHVLSLAAGPRGWNSFGVLVMNLAGFSEGILSTVTNESEETHTLPSGSVTVLVGDKIQNYRDYFSGRVFQRVQANAVWQPWEEVTAVKDSIVAHHLHGRLITADKLDITSVHRFIQDAELKHADNPDIWNFDINAWGPMEGAVDLTSGHTTRGIRIQGWLTPFRKVVYEPDRLFVVKENETLTLEFSLFQTADFSDDDNYGTVRIVFILVDASTAETASVAFDEEIPTDQAINTWHSFVHKYKIVRPQAWTRQVSYIKDFQIQYTGRPVASTVTDGTLTIAGFQVTRAAQGIYIGDGEIQTPHLEAGVVTADKANIASLTTAIAEVIQLNARVIVAGVLNAQRLSADVKNAKILWQSTNDDGKQCIHGSDSTTGTGFILPADWEDYDTLEFVVEWAQNQATDDWVFGFATMPSGKVPSMRPDSSNLAVGGWENNRCRAFIWRGASGDADENILYAKTESGNAAFPDDNPMRIHRIIGVNGPAGTSDSGGGTTGGSDNTEGAVTPGITVTPSNPGVVEGASVSVDVVLDSEPTSDVLLTIAESDTDISIDKTSMTFTDENWDEEQVLTITGEEDSDSTNDTAVILITASGGGYDGESANINVSIRDDENPAPPPPVTPPVVPPDPPAPTWGPWSGWTQTSRTGPTLMVISDPIRGGCIRRTWTIGESRSRTRSDGQVQTENRTRTESTDTCQN